MSPGQPSWCRWTPPTFADWSVEGFSLRLRGPAKIYPISDYPLLLKLAEVLKTGIGVSGEEICFYRRRTKKRQPRQPKSRQNRQPLDEYLLSVIEGCKQLGIHQEKLDPETVSQILSDEFGDDRPKLREVLPVVARRILQG